MALGQTAGCPRVNRAKKFMCSPRNTGNINFSLWLTGGLPQGCPDFQTWWDFRPQKKRLAPPNSPQTLSRPLNPPSPGRTPPPPGIFNKKPTLAPCLAPRTPPSPPPSRKNKKYPKRPPSKEFMLGVKFPGPFLAVNLLH